MLRFLMAAALALAALSSPASARPRAAISVCDNVDIMHPCAAPANFLAGVRSIDISMHRVRRHGLVVHRSGERSEGSSILPHPEGCPGRAFCGCGASVHLFGHPVRALYLAANWFRFPRAMPAPGMAAVRRHHVFVLEQHLEGPTWLAYDANSGGHATRLHARSIEGYAIVDPSAGARS